MERLRPEDPEKIGPWTIVGRLGSGGMGEVYIGKHGTELVAIKVLHRWLAVDTAFKSRFAREIESIGKLNSPNIAKYIDSDLSGDIGWLAIEYVDGPSLKEEIEVNGALDDKSWNSLARGLLVALKEMQLQNVVHRDIKPSNIILSKSGPKIVDFGLSQQVDSTSLTTTGLIAGSPAWISPEAINSEKLTIESDLFSIGSVLAFAKEGRNIWGDGLTAVVFNNIVTRNYKFSKLNSSQQMLIEDLFSKDLKIRVKGMNAFLSKTEVDSLKEISNFDPDRTEILTVGKGVKSDRTKISGNPKVEGFDSSNKVKNKQRISQGTNSFEISPRKSALQKWPLIAGVIVSFIFGAFQVIGNERGRSQDLAAIETLAPTPTTSQLIDSSSIKASLTPTISPSPKASKLVVPTKSPTPKTSASAISTPTSSWWPEYFSPWNATIAYKYSHIVSQGCTIPGHISGCYASHSIEVRVIEPCSTMSVDFQDEDGTVTVGYFYGYISTGQSFYTSTPDATASSSGRVSKITCVP